MNELSFASLFDLETTTDTTTFLAVLCALFLLLSFRFVWRLLMLVIKTSALFVFSLLLVDMAARGIEFSRNATLAVSTQQVFSNIKSQIGTALSRLEIRVQIAEPKDENTTEKE